MEKKEKNNGGVRRIAAKESDGVEVKIGSLDSPYHIKIGSREDGKYLNAFIPEDGYHQNTPDSKKGHALWIWKPVSHKKNTFTEKDAADTNKTSVKAKINKKNCGSALYWIEAFHSAPENKAPSGFYVSGKCEPKIIEIKWKKYQDDNEGDSLGASEVKFGDMLQLHIETEGLNGELLYVDFEEDEDGTIIDSVSNITYMGKLILNVPIKSIWRNKLFNMAEQAFNDLLQLTPIISFRHPDTGAKVIERGDFIEIQNEIAERKAEKGSAVPVSVGRVTNSPIRYNPCKFSAIVIKQKNREEFDLFVEKKSAFNKPEDYVLVAGKDLNVTEITIQVEDLETKYCIEKSNHTDKIFEFDSTIKKWVKSTTKDSLVLSPTYQYPESRSFPLSFIWLDVLKSQFHQLSASTCRYPNKNIKLRIYPDLKWRLEFFLNLTDDLSFAATGTATDVELKENQKKLKSAGDEVWSGKKSASFGFKLEHEWNKLPSGNYRNKEEIGLQYESKFKALHDIFSSIGDSLDVLTAKTMGKVKNTALGGLPIDISIKPPNVKIDGTWQKAIAKENGQLKNKIGTQVDITVQANPLIGMDVTFDLLGGLIIGAGGAISGGAATGGVIKLYNVVKGYMKEGVEVGNDSVGAEAQADIYIDLILSNTISANLQFSFNTESSLSDSMLKLEGSNKIGLEVKAGAYVKAKITIVIVSFEGYFMLEGSGKASITFGTNMTYDEEGLYLKPILGFDGLDVEYVIKGEAGLSLEKEGSKGKISTDRKEGITIAEKKINLLPKFDIIEYLKEKWNFDAKIALIKNDENE